MCMNEHFPDFQIISRTVRNDKYLRNKTHGNFHMASNIYNELVVVLTEISEAICVRTFNINACMKPHKILMCIQAL